MEVLSAQDPSGGDGINATSEAVAVADLDQSVGQNNDTSQSASGADVITGNVNLSLEQQQANLSEQEGTAIATGESNSVSVETYGLHEAGGDGINAESKAVAIAEIEQKANQDNTINQTATLESGQIVLTQDGSDQSNSNSDQEEEPEGQTGLSIASAESDSVDVDNGGDISAGGDGINAEFNSGGDCQS